jgi:hypothetical protein
MDGFKPVVIDTATGEGEHADHYVGITYLDPAE